MSSEYGRFRDELIRQFPELGRPAVYTGWLLGYLLVDPAPGTVEGVEVEDPERGPVPATWTPGRRYLLGQDRDSGRWARYLDSGHLLVPPQLEALLVVSRARFGADATEPPVAAWVLGGDGIGVGLADPPEGGSGRWLLLDGYVYDIHQAIDQPDRWAVNEARPPDPDIDHAPG